MHVSTLERPAPRYRPSPPQRATARPADTVAWVGCIASVALCAAVSACGPSKPRVTLVAQSGAEAQVTVEIARTDDELSRGLMWRTEMSEYHGMLFVFADEAPRRFWMKNTPLPLDIIYISTSGAIVSIAESTTPYSTASIPSKGPARYVLEVNAGFSHRHGIRPGASAKLPSGVPTPNS